MHRFHNYSFTIYHAFKELNYQQGERFMSYLPLCHIAERMLVQIGSLHVGGTVSFAESLETFAKNLQDSDMTVFLAVPRIWEKFQQGILAKLPQKKLDKLLSIPIISGIVKRKIRKTLGLTRAIHIYTGAAAAQPSVLEFFARLGIEIQEAYAMTENTCYSHVNFKNKIQIGSVGQPFPHCDVRISKEGEIQLKHEALMTGYYKEPQLTNEAFTEDGYLRTGDEGTIDKDGFLRITGRLKDLFKTSKGKYIAPVPIEMMIAESEDIDQICVAGVSLTQPIALAILSEIGQKKSPEEINKNLVSLLTSVNNQLDLHEEIAKIILLKEEWTPENEILTPTLKVKRKEIDKRYENNYEKWYSEKEQVVWSD